MFPRLAKVDLEPIQCDQTYCHFWPKGLSKSAKIGYLNRGTTNKFKIVIIFILKHVFNFQFLASLGVRLSSIKGACPQTSL